MLATLLVAAALLAHGLIHTGFLARPPVTAGGPPWPFELQSSWLLRPLGIPASTLRLLGAALVAATVGGFALAAVAALVSLPATVWIAGIALGTVSSAALLVLFFHPWLSLGIAIDGVLIWAVFVQHWVVS